MLKLVVVRQLVTLSGLHKQNNTGGSCFVRMCSNRNWPFFLRNILNHVSIPAVLFCMLNSKFTSFEGFLLSFVCSDQAGPTCTSAPSSARRRRAKTNLLFLCCGEDVCLQVVVEVLNLNHLTLASLSHLIASLHGPPAYLLPINNAPFSFYAGINLQQLLPCFCQGAVLCVRSCQLFTRFSKAVFKAVELESVNIHMTPKKKKKKKGKGSVQACSF